MEIFLPSLIIIIVLAFFVFLVLPRTGPMVLAVVSLIALIAAGLHHYTLFASEYRLSTWQYSLAAYTPWVVLGVSFLFIISAIMFMFSSPESKSKILETVATPMEAIQTAVTNSAAVMPSAASATNSVTATINRAINTTTNAAPAKPNNKKTPNIPGLGFAASNV